MLQVIACIRTVRRCVRKCVLMVGACACVYTAWTSVIYAHTYIQKIQFGNNIWLKATIVPQ